ncbi:hypothetical protein FJZ36_08790 [Candidatus Poribacteria bacterium]|nr:hypothetical protein [Candidatus Poribacteria bacterium]
MDVANLIPLGNVAIVATWQSLPALPALPALPPLPTSPPLPASPPLPPLPLRQLCHFASFATSPLANDSY